VGGYPEERALSFGGAADLYDLRRPSYPDAAVDHILAAVPGASRVLEIGAGTGKATRLFAARGVAVTAVEPDPLMADVLRRNVPSAEVAVSRFEPWTPSDAVGFDVAVSAQAWHWVDHAVGIPRLASLLRPGGAMAVMANVPRDGGIDLHDRLEPVYNRFVPDMPPDPIRNWTGDFDQTAGEFADSGLFAVDELWWTDWDERLSAEEFGELTQTHSTYRVLDADRRAALVVGLHEAIDAAGGSLTMWYRTAVLIARRPA
jgi:SAM-dependent methyltransferase